MLQVLDLFSGIGGFSLGLERTGGFVTRAFVELDPYCHSVLARHWPGVPIHHDVKELRGADLGFAPDLICGGFPCQDISFAGRGAGLAGERSGLWSEYRRLIEETRPKWVIAENVAALRSRGLGDVLRDLDALGYVGEWHCIPASAAGAPHRRDRIWIVAHLADRIGTRLEGHAWNGALGRLPLADGPTGTEGLRGREHTAAWWASEPDVGRVADGIPSRVDRLRCLGNAVVPQLPELIGRAILDMET